MDGDDGGGLFLSKDAGETWMISPTQPPSKRIYNGLAVSPLDSNVIFWAATSYAGGIYRSMDKGVTWSRVFRDSLNVFELKIAPDGVIYAGCDQMGPCLYMSKNNGTNWTLLKRFDSTPGTVDAIAIDPLNINRMAMSVLRWSKASPGKLFITYNRGEDWQNLTNDLNIGSGAAAMQFNANILWMVQFSGGVYKCPLK